MYFMLDQHLRKVPNRLHGNTERNAPYNTNPCFIFCFRRNKIKDSVLSVITCDRTRSFLKMRRRTQIP